MEKIENKKKRTWLRVVGLVVLLLVLSGGAYGYSLYQSVTKTAASIHQPIEREKSDKRVEELE